MRRSVIGTVELLGRGASRSGPGMSRLLLLPLAKTTAPDSVRFRSTSSMQGYSEMARERSKTVTSFYNQSAIDISAEKVSIAPYVRVDS